MLFSPSTWYNFKNFLLRRTQPVGHPTSLNLIQEPSGSILWRRPYHVADKHMPPPPPVRCKFYCKAKPNFNLNYAQVDKKIFHRQSSFKFVLIAYKFILGKENCTLVKLLLASYKHNFASWSAGHHSILQGRNLFNHPPSKLIGLVTPLIDTHSTCLRKLSIILK